MEYQVFLCIFQKNSAKQSLFGKCKKKFGFMKRGLDAMPLFLLDDLLRIKTDRQNYRNSSSVYSATVGAHGAYEVADKLVQLCSGYKTLEHINSSKKRGNYRLPLGVQSFKITIKRLRNTAQKLT